jgi:hypothetical protein
VFEKLGHKLLEHIALLKTLPVLSENCHIPDRIIRRQANEPANNKL